MSFDKVALDDFPQTFGANTELSSVSLGGKVISVSDEFFAEAYHLLLVEPAPSLKGQFGPKGALYSGWESRRHNPSYDWCLIKLGTSGSIHGFDIDTSNFNGNEGPRASVEALFSVDEVPAVSDPRWKEILPKIDLGPNARHLFKIPPTGAYNYVKLNMYPDGGIARFRVYGSVLPVYPKDILEAFDLAHVFAGGRVVYTSDQHFGVGSNLILPGRGKDMGDGWETKRSRQPGHKDWAIIKLGTAGVVDHAEVDTANFMGNFPESVELDGLHDPTTDVPSSDAQWISLVTRTKTGPHRRHFFHVEHNEPISHVRMTIHPDGGVKRVRIVGWRADAGPNGKTVTAEEKHELKPSQPASSSSVPSDTSSRVTVLRALPITPEAFAPFGYVVQAYADRNGAPRGTRITPANAGMATKFHKLAPVVSSYPANLSAAAGIAVYRCQPAVLTADNTLDIGVMERHPYTNQAFLPMGRAPVGLEGEGAIRDPAERYLVVVAEGGDEGPDMKTARAFIASAAQGVVYGTAVWHQPMTVLDHHLDLVCVETQVGDGSSSDCEIVELSKSTTYRVQV